MASTQKTQGCWRQLFSPKNVGERLPVSLAALLSLALLFHIPYEVWKMVCEAMPVSGGDSSLDAILIILDKTALTIASDNVRNLGLLLVASIGWYFLYRRTITAEQNTEAAQQNVVTAEKGLTTERLTRAIGQIAHKKSSVRLGGILGLKQIAFYHKEEREKVAQILSNAVHNFAPKDSETRAIGEQGKHSDITEAVMALAAITEMLPATEKVRICDLQYTNLSSLNFSGADLSHFRLLGVNFSNSYLWFVNFTGVRLWKVNFSGVSLIEPKGLTPEHLKEAFYWKGEPPDKFPPELVEHLLEKEKTDSE